MKPPVVVASLLAASLLVASGIHCDGTTGERRVRFFGTVRGSGADGTTARGWALHFDTFVAAFGPVRIYSDESFADPLAPACARLEAGGGGGGGGLLARLAVGVALAQHCHGCPRAPVAEFGFERGAAVDRAVDLLAPTAFNLGPANARNGLYRSVAFTFRSPVALADAGPAGAALEGHSMVVRGTATRGGQVVRFRGALDLQTLSEAAGSPTDARPYTTYGVMFDRPAGVFIESTNEATDHVAIRVELARMFDQADFSELPPPAEPGGEQVIAPDSQVYRAWRLGAEHPDSYRVGWVGAGGCGEPRGDGGT